MFVQADAARHGDRLTCFTIVFIFIFIIAVVVIVVVYSSSGSSIGSSGHGADILVHFVIHPSNDFNESDVTLIRLSPTVQAASFNIPSNMLYVSLLSLAITFYIDNHSILPHISTHPIFSTVSTALGERVNNDGAMPETNVSASADIPLCGKSDCDGSEVGYGGGDDGDELGRICVVLGVEEDSEISYSVGRICDCTVDMMSLRYV